MSEERITETLKTVKLTDGKEYSVKKFTLADTKRILPSIKRIDEIKAKEGITEELVELMISLVCDILKRTTPELTKEQVAEIVEIGSVYEIIFYAMGN